MNRQRLTAAVVALSALGLCRVAYFHFVVEPTEHPLRRIDQELRALVEALPREGEVGYVSDVPMEGSDHEVDEVAKRSFLQAQYAVAPVILRYDDATLPLVVVELAHPERLEQVLDRRRLRFRSWVAPKIALARPR